MTCPTQPGEPFPDRRDEIQQELARYGCRMEYDAKAMPGVGHNLVILVRGDAASNLPERILRLAQEWSRLTDDLDIPW